MVRKTTKRVVENARGGEGTVEFYDIVTKDELYGHGRVYAKTVIKPHSSIGFHVHEGETEPYYILEGKGVFVDHDMSRTEVVPGDVCVIEVGQGHAIENPNDEDLVIMALVYNA